MIVRQNRGYETSEDFPNSNWYENEPWNFVVDETTPEGQMLANKIRELYPFYDFVLQDGQLVDVVATPRPPEPEPDPQPTMDERVTALEGTVADQSQLLVEKGISP